VKRWLARHKRFILHFTPTSCSWLNLVERLFAEIKHHGVVDKDSIHREVTRRHSTIS
jgi:transposase